MREIFYRKVGRRYEPVSAYDSNEADSFPQGSHLVVVDQGWSMRRFNIQPNRAALLAAALIMEDRLAKIIQEATELRPETTPLTVEQRDAWENLARSLGRENIMLAWPSARQAAEEALRAMSQDAERLMSNPMVREAYNEFLAICKLTQESDNGSHK